MSSSVIGDGGSVSFSSANTDKKVHTTHLQPPKKKRNLPGNPDPNAEVISLSPTTLMARNRFVCEICNKGFQRDQNLQLHRRGHNLPWKLKQRSSGETARKRVFVCPEPSCVHHSPARALGDLTGIKKHFSRKHGDKKWKCDKCSKKYAVQSDWKAHIKTCGTKEYKCDCGTIFSRRDSFITHRAFCDAIAEENSKAAANDLSSLAISSNPLISASINSTNTNTIFGSGLMSATALLQKAAQMGATATTPTPANNVNDNNYNNATAFPKQSQSGFETAMAPASFGNMLHHQNANSYDRHLHQAMAAAMDGGMFSGLFDENNAILRQQADRFMENHNHQTVDFLGIGRGGSSSAAGQADRFTHFHPHAMDKPMWPDP